MISKLLPFLSLVLLPEILPAQYVLSGRINDSKTGEPIVSATLYSKELNIAAVSDADGVFFFKKITSDSISLEIRSISYKTKYITVKLPHPDTLLILMELSSSALDELVVSTLPLGRNIAYQPTQSFNSEEIQRRAAPSLGQLLDGEPGVAMRSLGSAPARPVIRGLDGDRVLILQNGERMGDLQETAADHALAADPLALERVEIVRGPASLLYGSSAIGGVINLFSHDLPWDWDKGSSTSIMTQGATVNNMAALYAQTKYGGGSTAFSARFSHRDAGNTSTPAGKLPSTFLETTTFAGGIGQKIGDAQAGVSVNFIDGVYGLPGGLEQDNQPVMIDMNRWQIQGKVQFPVRGLFYDAELRLQLNQYKHLEVETDVAGNVLPLSLGFEQQSAGGTLTLKHRNAGFFESGAVGFSGFYRDLSVQGTDALTPDVSGGFLAMFLFEEIGISKSLSLQMGSRAEYRKLTPGANHIFTNTDEFSEREDAEFAGSLGLHIKPANGLEFGFQVARAFRSPTAEELFSNAVHIGAGAFEIGNESLKNERSIGIDFFSTLSFHRFTLDVSAFRNSISDFVKYTPTGNTHAPSQLPIFTYSPVDAILTGFEVSALWNLHQNWNIGGSLDYVKGEETSSGDALPQITPFRASLNAKYNSGAWFSETTLRIVAAQNRVAPEEDRTSGYSLVNALIGYKFTARGKHSLILKSENLLDETYRDHLSRIEDRGAPMPGRNIQLSWRWDF